MAELGVRWCVLVPTVFSESAASEHQYRHFALTPDDTELRHMIEQLHGKGIHVHLRPMLETLDGHGRNMIWFPPDRERIPGRISAHRAAWFRSMTERTVHYARIAQEMGCAWYGLDSELDRMTDENDHWKAVIAAARSVYQGPIDSTHTRQVDVLAELKRRPDHWFYDLDGLSVSYYNPIADHPGARVAEMMVKAQELLPYYREIATTFGKTFLFGEIGCRSSTGAAMHPGHFDGAGQYFAPEEQANFMEAVCRVFSPEPWWRGFYWWKWEEQTPRPVFKGDPAGDKGFTIYGKRAAQIFAEWTQKL